MEFITHSDKDVCVSNTDEKLGDRMKRYENQIDFNKTELPSGIYLYELRIGSVSALKKLILIK